MDFDAEGACQHFSIIPRRGMKDFLLIDTTFRGAAAGLARIDSGGEVDLRFCRFFSEVGGSAEGVFSILKEVLQGANHTFQSLDGIAVTVGPGSFTGIKIGISLVQGIVRGIAQPHCPSVVSASTLLAYQRGIGAENVAIIMPCTRTHGFLGFHNQSKFKELCFDLHSFGVLDNAEAQKAELSRIDLLASWPEFVKQNPLKTLLLRESIACLEVQRTILMGMARIVASGEGSWQCLEPNYLRLSTAEEARNRSATLGKGREIEIV